MKLEQVILRDTRANQPLATVVPIGSLFYVTDEQVIERTNGAIWQSYSGSILENLEFITTIDETVKLPNSRRLVAGTSIILDDAVPGILTINGAIITEIIGITHNGNPMTTGIKGSFIIPWAGTITRVLVLADVSGTLEFDILKTDFATFPAGGTSIVAAAPPGLTTAQKYSDSVLTGWTTVLAVNDILEYELTVVDAGITRVSLFLVVELD